MSDAAHDEEEFASPWTHGRDSTPELRLVAMREHSLLSLFELSHELTVVLGVRGIADLALFNLMGHLGTGHAALWLESTASPSRLEVVRSFGIRPEIAQVMAAALSEALPSCPRSLSTPIRIADAVRVIDPAAVTLADHAGLALLAPLIAGQRALGFLALGRRASGDEFTDLDLDVLNASLGMVAVAFENRRLYASVEHRNAELERANQELRAVDRLKSEFLQTVNHELRTPLAIIIGCADCLLQSPDPDPTRRRFATGVLEQASKLQTMVQTLLDFSGTFDGTLELQLEELDARAVAQEFYDSRKPRVTASHPDFGLVLELERGTCRADRARVDQVLDALLDNAVKFTPPGARIEIGVATGELAGRGAIAFRISDRGPGISPEHLADLFEPFRQADGSATRTVGGLGMGLATARRVAEHMGARLTVETVLEQGTTFTLMFPRSAVL